MIQRWYNGMTPGQRGFLWILSTALILCYGVGLAPLALLIYCKLGNQREAYNSSKNPFDINDTQ